MVGGGLLILLACLHGLRRAVTFDPGASSVPSANRFESSSFITQYILCTLDMNPDGRPGRLITAQQLREACGYECILEPAATEKNKPLGRCCNE